MNNAIVYHELKHIEKGAIGSAMNHVDMDKNTWKNNYTEVSMERTYI